MTKEELTKEVKHLIHENKKIRIKQTAMVEMVCHLRTRIDATEREINDNDKKIKALKKEYWHTKYAIDPSRTKKKKPQKE